MADFNTNGVMKVGGLVVGPNDDWGIAFGNDSTLKIVRSPFAGDATKVYSSWSSTGAMTSSPTYSTAGTASFQTIAGDLNLGATAGSSTSGTPAYLAGGMFNIIGTGGNSATQNIINGLAAKIDLQGTISSTYPASAFQAEIGDGVTGAYATVLGVVGGDSTASTVIAIFGVDWQSSLPATKTNFGLDLQGNGTHDGFKSPYYAKADIRLGGFVPQAAGTDPISGGQDVLIGRKNGAPTSGTSGTWANDAGPGSLLIDTTNAKLYINTNTKASPTWTVVGSQS